MRTGKGCIEEIYSADRYAARISCPANLVPAPGQYVLAVAATDVDAPLAVPVYSAGPAQAGFLAARPLPASWLPGAELDLRGPFGHGFQLPVTARFVALASYGKTIGRLYPLLEQALAQNAAVVLLADQVIDALPAEVEVSGLAALPEIVRWADYLAIDIPRSEIDGRLRPVLSTITTGPAQVLVETPVPCAGMADCGVCAVNLRRGYKLACKDGPVFDLKTILE